MAVVYILRVNVCRVVDDGHIFAHSTAVSYVYLRWHIEWRVDGRQPDGMGSMQKRNVFISATLCLTGNCVWVRRMCSRWTRGHCLGGAAAAAAADAPHTTRTYNMAITIAIVIITLHIFATLQNVVVARYFFFTFIRIYMCKLRLESNLYTSHVYRV